MRLVCCFEDPKDANCLKHGLLIDQGGAEANNEVN